MKGEKPLALVKMTGRPGDYSFKMNNLSFLIFYKYYNIFFIIFQIKIVEA